MKITLRILFSAVLAGLFFAPLGAQVTVVKQDGKTVYLDTSELSRNVQVGDTFKIILSRETLTNPKTGKTLGDVYQYSEDGRITEVQPLYAVGQLPQKGNYVGQEAVITAGTAAQSAAATPAKPTAQDAAAETAPISNRKQISYPAIDGIITAAVQADFTALPGQEIITADDKGTLTLYRTENNTLQPLASYALPAGKRVLSLSASNEKNAALFTVLYDTRKEQIHTWIFNLQNNAFEQTSSLPYWVEELGCGTDKKLYAQKPFIGGAKGGDIRLLTHQNGQWKAGEKAFSSRGSWLPGTAFYPIEKDNANNPLFTLSNGTLRLQLSNGKYAQSPALFAGAPNRVKYKQGFVSFYPAVVAYGRPAKAEVAALENTAKLGLLSEQFGSYNGGKLHFLTHENGVLKVAETLPLDGYAYSLRCTQRGILVAQVLPGGQSILTEIYR